ncbi:MAG: hypothetical protein KAZ88_03835 [Acidimicrobiia bacterium]|jgi:hypothetical protein|nr:hypothetical protein [Acidimicrobiia bacterium]
MSRSVSFRAGNARPNRSRFGAFFLLMLSAVFVIAACSSDSSDDDASGNKFCDEANRVNADRASVDSIDAGLEVFQKMVNDAPEQIAQQADIASEVVNLWLEGDFDALQPYRSEFKGNAEVVLNYLKDECGIDLYAEFGEGQSNDFLDQLDAVVFSEDGLEELQSKQAAGGTTTSGAAGETGVTGTTLAGDEADTTTTTMAGDEGDTTTTMAGDATTTTGAEVTSTTDSPS